MGKATKCSKVHRVPLANVGIVIGGVSVGQCENERFPGLVVCFEHADKETLALMVQTLLRDYERDTGKKHHYVRGAG